MQETEVIDEQTDTETDAESPADEAAAAVSGTLDAAALNKRGPSDRAYILAPGLAQVRREKAIVATIDMRDLDRLTLVGLALEGGIQLFLKGASVEDITGGKACPERKPPLDKAALKEAERLAKEAEAKAKLAAEREPLLSAIHDCRAALNYSLFSSGEPRASVTQKAAWKAEANAHARLWVSRLPEEEIMRLAETRQVQAILRPPAADFADVAADIAIELDEQQAAAE